MLENCFGTCVYGLALSNCEAIGGEVCCLRVKEIRQVHFVSVGPFSFCETCEDFCFMLDFPRNGFDAAFGNIGIFP